MAENVSRIEPCHLPSYDPRTAGLIADLGASAKLLGARLHPATAATLAELVRVMNCYYSNLIEGHNTRPRDLERALQGTFDSEGERRNLQLEARAHIRVQRELDRLAAEDALPEPASVAFIRFLHEEFYRDAPEQLLTTTSGGRTLRVIPGRFRERPEEEVAVGRHQPPSSARVAEFMDYFASRYRFDRMTTAERIAAIATAHHRFNYIHPFVDGNGRVSRLMSHAMAHLAGIGAQGLWSVSRGLARGLRDGGEYKRMMDLADTPRESDRDGRGNLSLRCLEELVQWMVEVCLDQVRFMASLFELETLGARLVELVARERLRPEAGELLRIVLVRGQIARGEVPAITQLQERTARALLSDLLGLGLLASETPKGPVSLRFPIGYVDELFPRLFPASWGGKDQGA